MKARSIFPLLFLLLVLPRLQAQDTGDRSQSSWHFAVKPGINIGAVAPTSMPKEIREIKGYSPLTNGSLYVEVSHPIGDSNLNPLQLVSGIIIERNSMKTHARVKNYSTEIRSDGNTVAGVWTGDVKTRYSATALKVPLSVRYRVNPTLYAHIGIYGAWLISKSFGGSVMDGYLREGNPTGEKALFENGQSASYNFDNQLRELQWGLCTGIEWHFFQRFLVSGQFSYGLNNIFKHDFKTISFEMHPIFFNVSIGILL
ncbi:MAG: PorT family protein [Bacteroidales bacterium]|nr:PorT family protein [Bacteroidales bacterium]